MSTKLEQAIRYFEKHRSRLADEQHGKVAAISGDKELGFFDTLEEAYKEASKVAEPGSFLLRKCVRKEEEKKVTLRTRAA